MADDLNKNQETNNTQDSSTNSNGPIDLDAEKAKQEQEVQKQQTAQPKEESVAERILRQQQELDESQENLGRKIEEDTKNALDPMPTQADIPEKFDESKLSTKAQDLLANLDSSKNESLDYFGGSVVDQNTQAAMKVLDSVQTKQTSELGKQLTTLSLALKDVPDAHKNQNFLSKLFHKVKMSTYQLQTEYQKAGTTINNIADELKKKADTLNTNNNDMRDMYHDRIKYYQSLNDYIAAGEVKQQHLLEMDIPRAKMAMDGKTGQERFDAELKYKQLVSYQNRLSKRVYDLRSAQTLAYQQIQQLQMMAASNIKLIDTIHTSISMAIPVWYEQATMYLFAESQKEANDANQLVVDATNKMIEQNGMQITKQMIDITKASENPVIKPEVLEKNYQNILNGIKNSQAIIDSSEKNREANRKKLIKMNDDFHKQIEESLTSARANEMLADLKDSQDKN